MSTWPAALSVLVSVLLLLLAAAGCSSEQVSGVTSAVTATAAPPATPTINVARETARGKRLAENKGCLGCHTVDGRDQVGPTWKGLFGKAEELDGGATIVVDRAYLKESIEDPNARIVEGYLSDIMPKLDLPDDEMTAIVEYISSLR